MNRRSFLAAASTLFLPYEPRRVYSFGEDVGRISGVDWGAEESSVIWTGRYDVVLSERIDEVVPFTEAEFRALVEMSQRWVMRYPMPRIIFRTTA